MVQRPGFAMTQESSRPMSLRFVPTKKAELVKTYQYDWQIGGIMEASTF